MISPMRLLLFLILPLAILPRGVAQEVFFRHVTDTATDTHVEVTSLFSEPSQTGFLPVRVKMSNNLKNPRTARFEFTSSPGYRDRIRSNSSFAFDVPGGKTLTRDILVPICPSAGRSFGNQVRVQVTMRGGFGSDFGSVDARPASGLPDVLLSGDLFTGNSSRLDAEVAKSRTGRPSGGNRFAAKFTAAQLPSDWLAYSGYDCLIVSEPEWSSVPAGARNAILSWVRLGGRLIICTRGNATKGMLSLPEDAGYGSCELFPELEINSSGTLELPAKETVELVRKSPPVQSLQDSLASSYPSGWPLQNVFGTRGFQYGLFIAVLIVFSILVGPVNLFVFAKSGRRHRLFLTTPVIALAASLLLVALIILQDGFGGEGERLVLMEVRPDSGENAAYIHQEQFSRTGIMLGDEFTVDPASFVTPVPIGRSRWARYTNSYDTRGAFDLQPEAGKLNASGDWWQSRSEHGHLVSAIVPTRGRIEATPTQGQMMSTFEFPIDRLYYLDESGQWHRASDIRTGKRFTLTPVERSMVEPELASEAGRFVKRHRRMFQRARMREGHFIAITDSAPGIATHPGIRWRKTHTVITGPVFQKH